MKIGVLNNLEQHARLLPVFRVGSPLAVRQSGDTPCERKMEKLRDKALDRIEDCL